MSRVTYVMVECEACGSADYYHPGSVTQQARTSGWVVSKHGDFCTYACKRKYLLEQAANRQEELKP